MLWPMALGLYEYSESLATLWSFTVKFRLSNVKLGMLNFIVGWMLSFLLFVFLLITLLGDNLLANEAI